MVEAAATVEGTPWVRGRFDALGLPRAILFGRMYEDMEVERRVLPTGGRVCCIASAGDNAHALAPRHDQVVALDINPVQLSYTRQRLDGAPARLGTAEQLMRAFRALLPAAGLTRRKLEAFLALDDVAAQERMWHQELRTRRLQRGMRGLLSVTGLKAFYASPFLSVLPDHFGQVMLSRLDRCFARHPNRQNPFARALFLGEDTTPRGPARGRIELVCADAAGYLESQPPQSFDGFTLSNILDGASDVYRVRLLEAVKRAARPGAVLVLRSFGEPGDGVALNLAAEDRSMLWGVVEVRSF
jgi:S-adenosylmethionine:diacylglycerol 3-amino-3-carboxypropyl transferase